MTIIFPTKAAGTIGLLLSLIIPVGAQTYTVGAPVCDTISAVNSYGGCEWPEVFTVRLDSSLIPYVAGLRFEFHVTGIHGHVTYAGGGIVEAGDVFPLPAANASGEHRFGLAPYSFVDFIAKIVGTPQVAGERYACPVQPALTLAVCDNSLTYFGWDDTCTVAPSLSVESWQNAPTGYALLQNYPNPFNPDTKIVFVVPASAPSRKVMISVFDNQGQLVRVLCDREAAPGRYEIVWDGKDMQGRDLPSGTYVYRLKAGSVVMARKMALVR